MGSRTYADMAQGARSSRTRFRGTDACARGVARGLTKAWQAQWPEREGLARFCGHIAATVSAERRVHIRPDGGF
jgi:hypothetical protein